MLCQSLNLSKVLPIAGRLRSTKDLSISGGLACIDVLIAKASIILGDFKLASRSLTLAKDELSSEELYSAANEGNDIDIDTSERRIVTGGKKSWKAYDESRHESLEVLFLFVYF